MRKQLIIIVTTITKLLPISYEGLLSAHELPAVPVLQSPYSDINALTLVLWSLICDINAEII